MDDKTLVRISLIWSLIGILVLIAISLFAKPPTVSISALEDYLGKEVVIEGLVGDTTYQEDFSFIELKSKYDKVTVFAFENLDKKVYKNDEIRVKGKVQTYKGELEIIANEISCIKCAN